MEKVLENLIKWKAYVSLPREELEGFAICPFAKNTTLVVNIISSEQELLIDVLKKEKEQHDMFIFVDVNKKLTSKPANVLIDFYNSISNEYQYFLDDYQNPNYIGNIPTDNKHYIIIIGQKIPTLNDARKKLKKTSYYKFLSDDYLKKIGVY